MHALRITIGPTTILGAPDLTQRRVQGLFVAKDGFEGWDDGGGDTVREAVPRPLDHGEYDLPAFSGPRLIAITGHALAWSPQELAQQRSQTMGLAATGRTKITVQHQGQTLWANVRRAGKPTFTDKGIRYGRHHAKFFLQFLAADPRKYGETRDYPAGQEAVHYGNFPARPLVIVTGTAASGYTITGPQGRTITVSRALAANAPHTIDMARGGLYIGGVRQVGAMTVYQPWTVGPGIPGATATVTGGLSLVQRVTDTFI